MRFHLASTSPARLMLMRQAGIEPVLLASDVDEDLAVAAHEAEHGPATTAQVVQLLARAKAEAVLGREPEGRPMHGLLFGGDSALELDGATLGKPHTPERARERWLAQRGREAVLHSGHWLVRLDEGRVVAAAGATVATRLRFAELDDDEIDAYVATGEPLEVAGAFTIDSLGSAYVAEIHGDPSTVVGMSIPTVRRLARGLGATWHELWNR
ncbi:Maf family protein [Agrococcus versicolor]|uniref:Nucleoside triphosphate pyrophosphatase n=1 Tax=Agrococcus versicolor TaxID=501482 RepID=A0ABN3AKS9_9MICO